jgi:hypothetical protein
VIIFYLCCVYLSYNMVMSIFCKNLGGDWAIFIINFIFYLE